VQQFRHLDHVVEQSGATSRTDNSAPRFGGRIEFDVGLWVVVEVGDVVATIRLSPSRPWSQARSSSEPVSLLPAISPTNYAT